MTEKEIKIVLVKDELGVVNDIQVAYKCTIMDMLIGAVALIEKAAECVKEENTSLAEILVKLVQAKRLTDLVLEISKQKPTEETPKDTGQTE